MRRRRIADLDAVAGDVFWLGPWTHFPPHTYARRAVVFFGEAPTAQNVIALFDYDPLYGDYVISTLGQVFRLTMNPDPEVIAAKAAQARRDGYRLADYVQDTAHRRKGAEAAAEALVLEYAAKAAKEDA